MRFLLLTVFFGLVSSAVLENVAPDVDYHDSIGIPLAAKIKAQEDATFMRVHTEAQDPRIVGGVVSPVNAHPYLAGVVIYMFGTTDVSACGSSILTANRMVTAAHCWWSTRHLSYQFEMVFGSQWLFYGGTRIVTSNVHMHPQYNPSTLVNDIAMVYLPSNVNFGHNIQPIQLPTSTQLWEDFTGWTATAVGYGKTSDLQNGVSLSTVVSQVTVQVISNIQCQWTFQNWVTAGNLCTSGVGGVGICGGDSGGPLVVTSNGVTTLIGISSFVADTGCEFGHPSAFTRVTTYFSFILSHLI